jgi:hypothetical protein
MKLSQSVSIAYILEAERDALSFSISHTSKRASSFQASHGSGGRSRNKLSKKADEFGVGLDVVFAGSGEWLGGELPGNGTRRRLNKL